jgi:cysteine sulfinate desulfinase/cysteine desulfurase-like protein
VSPNIFGINQLRLQVRDFSTSQKACHLVALRGITGEALMNLLDLKGICVCTSSACDSSKSEPSHVLLALGQSEQQAKSAITQKTKPRWWLQRFEMPMIKSKGNIRQDE